MNGTMHGTVAPVQELLGTLDDLRDRAARHDTGVRRFLHNIKERTDGERGQQEAENRTVRMIGA